jgi:hypothetical protein
MPKLQYIFTPAIETRMRLAWSLRKRERTAAIDAIVRDTRFPRGIIKQRAQRLGLCTERRTIWTAEQDRQLLMLLGEHSARVIARTMHRSVESIRCRAAILDLSAHVRDGYPKRDVMRILGAPRYRVEQWLDNNWLKANAETGRITDDSLTAFIRKHIDEIDFRLADQNYLKGVFRRGTTESISRAVTEGAARRGQETRLRSRSAERTFQLPFPEHGGDAGAAEMPAFMGQEDARHSVAEEGLCEIR